MVLSRTWFFIIQLWAFSCWFFIASAWSFCGFFLRTVLFVFFVQSQRMREFIFASSLFFLSVIERVSLILSLWVSFLDFFFFVCVEVCGLEGLVVFSLCFSGFRYFFWVVVFLKFQVWCFQFFLVRLFYSLLGVGGRVLVVG